MKRHTFSRAKIKLLSYIAWSIKAMPKASMAPVKTESELNLPAKNKQNVAHTQYKAHASKHYEKTTTMHRQEYIDPNR